MSSNDYCRFLKLPGEFFNKEELMDELKGDLVTYNNAAGRHWRNWEYERTPFNDLAKEWARSLGCTFANAEVFYTKPGGILPWHTDMNPPGPISKINFVWGSDNHSMDFGEIKHPETHRPSRDTMVNSQYTMYAHHEISNVTSFKLDRPALLNVGKPHRVVNFSTEGRWCLCMILWKDGERIFWEDALKLFSEYVLD